MSPVLFKELLTIFCVSKSEFFRKMKILISRCSLYDATMRVSTKKARTSIIYTDHQPLTFSVSESNPNFKTKRWKARIYEAGAKVFYKPGKENLVADELSRQQANAMETQEISLTHAIDTTDKQLNCFQNQIVQKVHTLWKQETTRN